MYLETPRTAVRPFAPGDRDALYKIPGSAGTMRFSQPPGHPGSQRSRAVPSACGMTRNIWSTVTWLWLPASNTAR